MEKRKKREMITPNKFKLYFVGHACIGCSMKYNNNVFIVLQQTLYSNTSKILQVYILLCSPSSNIYCKYYLYTYNKCIWPKSMLCLLRIIILQDFCKYMAHTYTEAVAFAH